MRCGGRSRQIHLFGAGRSFAVVLRWSTSSQRRPENERAGPLNGWVDPVNGCIQRAMLPARVGVLLVNDLLLPVSKASSLGRSLMLMGDGTIRAPDERHHQVRCLDTSRASLKIFMKPKNGGSEVKIFTGGPCLGWAVRPAPLPKVAGTVLDKWHVRRRLSME